jgi:crossover junction endodeoxyribonuclease RuvC
METLFFKTVGARSVILSAQCRGVLIYVLAGRGVPVEEITPASIKLAITGSGKASKRQMNYMIRQLLRLDDDVQEHAADALAAAFCLARRASPALGAK